MNFSLWFSFFPCLRFVFEVLIMKQVDSDNKIYLGENFQPEIAMQTKKWCLSVVSYLRNER